MKIKINGKMVECRSLMNREKILKTDVHRDGERIDGFYIGYAFNRMEDFPLYRPIKPKNPKAKPWGSFKIKSPQPKNKMAQCLGWTYGITIKRRIHLNPHTVERTRKEVIKRHGSPIGAENIVPITITLRAPRTKKENQ